MIIARCVFSELQTEYRAAWLVLDYFSDFMYVLDTLAKFRTGKNY